MPGFLRENLRCVQGSVCVYTCVLHNPGPRRCVGKKGLLVLLLILLISHPIRHTGSGQVTTRLGGNGENVAVDTRRFSGNPFSELFRGKVPILIAQSVSLGKMDFTQSWRSFADL